MRGRSPTVAECDAGGLYQRIPTCTPCSAVNASVPLWEFPESLPEGPGKPGHKNVFDDVFWA